MKIREITQIALVTAVIIVLGMIPPIPLGFIPVPIVLQNLGIMIAGIVLGPKRGTVSVALFLFLVLIGFPVLSKWWTGRPGGLCVADRGVSGRLAVNTGFGLEFDVI